MALAAFGDESDTTFQYEDMLFEPHADGTATFIRYTGSSKTLTIPETAYFIHGEWSFDAQGNYVFTEYSRECYRVTEMASRLRELLG